MNDKDISYIVDAVDERMIDFFNELNCWVRQ